jgi:hypothetical protein
MAPEALAIAQATADGAGIAAALSEELAAFSRRLLEGNTLRAGQFAAAHAPRVARDPPGADAGGHGEMRAAHLAAKRDLSCVDVRRLAKTSERALKKV